MLVHGSPHFRRFGGAALAWCALTALGLGLHAAGAAGQVALSPTLVMGGLINPAAIEYLPTSGSFIVATRPATSAGRAFENVTAAGGRFEYGPALALPADAPMAIEQDEEEFEQGQVFTSRGAPGQIVRLAPGGKLAGNPWVTLPGESGTVTALSFSHGGPYQFDLLAGASSGNIWRVSEAGHPVFVASVGAPIQALLALPLAPGSYGDSAGKLLVATSGSKCQLLAVDAVGVATLLNAGSCFDDLDLIVPDTDAFFTGALRVNGKPVSGVLTAAAVAFETSRCGILATPVKGPSLTVLTLSAGGVYASIVGTADAAISRTAFAASAIACQPEICGDEIDNNADGDVDEGCEEVCGDGVDNNSDGEVDEGCPEVCGDGEDNDANGLADDGCHEVCGDLVDNDGDGLVDAACPEICGDHVDNDVNGIVDDGCPPPAADAGCAPERWLLSPDSWVGLQPKEAVGGVFIMPAADLLGALAKETLTAILGPPPPPKPEVPDSQRAPRQLLRAATAGLLNASQPVVSYPIPPAVIAENVRGALASGNPAHMQALAGVLAAYNKLGCKLPPPKSPEK